jgi:EAL domain-containing protein (putative c-di-GMP-specific phosphodiesterase class I)
VKLQMGSFGTGYTSLGCLHRLRLDGIKIDRTLIARSEERRDYAAVVLAITGLTRGLGMSVVAEGVETHDHVAMLQALGCEYGQGYYFGAPMGPEEAGRFLAQPFRRKLSA